MLGINPESVARTLNGEVLADGSISAPGPGHKRADDRSLSIKIDPGAPGGFVVHSFASDDWKTCRDYVRQKLGLPEWEPAKKKRAAARIVATYDYKDEAGALISQAVRYEPKTFKQRRPDGAGGWLWRMKGARLVPYRLPAIVETIAAGRPIFIVEGEKDADALARLDLAATCNATGAGNWKAAHSECLAGADVIILPDNDAPGRDHAEKVAAGLAGSAARVRILALPDLPDKGDVSDWIDAGGDRDALMALVDSEARDCEASKNAPEPAKPALDGSRINGDLLLKEIERFVRRFLALPSVHAYVAIVLWIAHAHRMEVWDCTPRLLFTSYQPGSGKSRCLEITALLVPRPMEAFNVSAAYLVRKVSTSAGTLPTILYDEIDALFGGGKASERTEDIRAIINAGHRRGAQIGRCKMDSEGNVTTEELPAYCAVAMAGLDRRLPDTITTRSVMIVVKRRRNDEIVEPLRRRLVEADAQTLRDGLAAWAQAIMPTHPNLPASVTDRDADVWEPLISMADAAGGEWGERARTAACEFVEARRAAPVSPNVRLLADIKAAFDSVHPNGQPCTQMSTVQLLGILTAMDEAPWGDLRGKPLTDRQLAARLKPFEVRPGTIRTGDLTPRGYKRASFVDAWARYL